MKFDDDDLFDTVEDYGNGFGSFGTKAVALLLCFIGVAKVFDYILSDNIVTVEHLAEISIRFCVAIVKISLCGLFLYALYKVFIEPSKKRNTWEDD